MASETFCVPVLKVCGIQTPTEAALAIRCGAHSLGFVGSSSAGAKALAEEDIIMMAPMVPVGTSTFLLISAVEVEAIIEPWTRSGARIVQLCDAVPVPVLRELRRRVPDGGLAQVIRASGPEVIPYARAASRVVDWLLVDAGEELPQWDPARTSREEAWKLCRRIRDEAFSPVFLAGGLHAGNVAEAIRVVRPYGVEVGAEMRTCGKLDEAKLRAVLAAMKSARLQEN